MRIAPLTPNHSPQLTQLHQQAFKKSWQDTEFQSLLSQPAVYGWGAFNREAILGFILVQLAMDEGEILAFAVAPAYRHQRIGTQLLNIAQKNLSCWGCRSLFLEVRQDNQAAISLYEKQGFTQVGKRNNYYREAKGERSPAYIYHCSLEE